MTAGGFSGVDLDLLADYVGGALDGTPDRVRVARLVADDPDWARAHDLLAPAVEDVRVDLAGWGAEPETMPADVSARLTAALAGAPALPGPPPSVPAQSRSGLSVVRGGAGTGPGSAATGGRGTAAAKARRRWSRVAAPLGVAAAVAAFAGFGVSHLTGSTSGESAQTSAVPESAAAPDEPHLQGGRTPGRVLASGTDYTATSLPGAAGAEPGSGPQLPRSTGAGPAAVPPEAERMATPAQLDRLRAPAALGACLDAVAAEHTTGVTTVDLVDFASFEGRPALVVVFTDQGGRRWAWAVGPECGVPGSGADTRQRGPVG